MITSMNIKRQTERFLKKAQIHQKTINKKPLTQYNQSQTDILNYKIIFLILINLHFLDIWMMYLNQIGITLDFQKDIPIYITKLIKMLQTMPLTVHKG